MDELVLAEQGVFLTTDARGEIPVGAPDAFGLYYRDTRFLSGFALRLDGVAVPLLGVEDSGYVSTLTYGEIAESPVRTPGIPPNVLVRRTRYLAVPDGRPVLRERIAVTSYDRDALDVVLALALAADFKDIFEIRRITSGERPPYQAPQTLASDTIVLAYTGRDDVRRRTVCHLTPAPDEVVTLPGAAVRGNGGDGYVSTAGEPGVTAGFTLRLEPRQVVVIELTIEPASSDAADALLADTPAPQRLTFEEGLATATALHDAWLAACTRIETDNAMIDRVLDRSLRDLRLLLLQFPTGPYLAAGIPWFAVPFGRDALIGALEMLSVNRDIAVGTLRYLAVHQGRRVDPERDEEPGKVMHEMRAGEMVQTGSRAARPLWKFRLRQVPSNKGQMCIDVSFLISRLPAGARP